MAFPIGKILMAYRPLYLRGLLMDGQYRLPAASPVPTPETGKRAAPSKEVVAERAPGMTKPLRGALT
ncbi:hypothetical protein DVT68_11620 [Dyella solisilvae]|uniref:Uncharacterized protein n=1 Tax=Dyella solisilvae TaxID=1920168 RepID=A0A370KAR8_9GAMM|nr:hypothetical protein [Dyella solisilvae]RDI99120.1 hypothetical protein DVT68_11620 [Dyella solisilvae]